MFIFVFYTYIGFKSNSFDAINEKSYSRTAIIRHIGFYATVKNAQHLQVGIHRIWNQQPQIDLDPSKNFIYVDKQGWALSSSDYYE